MPELINQEFIIEGHYVTMAYKNGDLIDITIQEKDGTVLFSGRPLQLETLASINTWLASRLKTEA